MINTEKIEIRTTELLERSPILDIDPKKLQEAIKIVKQLNRVSVSMLQRRLHLGYVGASRIIDELEIIGIIGPITKDGREVYK